jgi:Tfp pilus assembly protein PilF
MESARDRARQLFEQAYAAQMRGDLAEAERLYTASIEACPTAEAYTFRGWVYGLQGRLDEAIAECQKAIALDPEYGNPYNDIGAYLIEKGCLDEAIPWLLKAMMAPRYEARVYPHVNLARIWTLKGQWTAAVREYRRALRLDPDYEPARRALAELLGRLN